MERATAGTQANSLNSNAELSNVANPFGSLTGNTIGRKKILGANKVQPNNRIKIIRKVQKKLNINVGDVLMYIEDDKGNITIKKSPLKPT